MRIKPANRLNSVGEYYFSKTLREIEKMRNSGIHVINLGIGSPDLPPSEGTVNRLIRESLNKDNHAYQSYTGIPQLKKAFAKWYKTFFSVHLDWSNEVLPLIGSKEGIHQISMAFVDEGDEVLIPNPGYPTYAAVTRLVSGRVVNYDLLPENDWLPDFDRLEKMDLSRVKIMWTNYPHMPTGRPATLQLMQRLVDFGLKHNILIVNDNPYSFILNKEYISIMQAEGAKDIALELNSLSKSHNMSGWRIGVLIGQNEFIKTVLKVKSNMDSGMFKPVQLAAVQALSSSEFWYSDLNQVYSNRRKIVFDILDEFGFSYEKNQAGMFVWAKINHDFIDAEHFSNWLLKIAGIFITPGFIFGSNGNDYIRISLCSDEETLMDVKQKISKLKVIN